MMFDVQKFAKSMQHAWRGVRTTYKHEQNFRIQIIVAVLVIAVSSFLAVPEGRFLLILVLITLVLLLELLNTAVERMLDVIKPRFSEQVQVIKDIMAAAVFIASLASLIIGSIILIPKIAEQIIQYM